MLCSDAPLSAGWPAHPSLACFATEHRSACLCGSWGLGLYLFLSRPKTPTPSAFSLTQFSPLSPPARFHSVLVPRRPTPTPTSSFFMIPAFICNPTEASPGRPPPKTQHGSPYNPKVSAVSPSFDFPLCPLASCKLVFKEVVFVLQVRVGVNVASVAPCEEQGAPTGQGVSLICKPGGGGGICPRSACPPGPLQPISSCSRLWGQQPGHRGRRCPPGDQDGRARGPRPSTCAGGQGTERLAQHSPGPRLNGRRLSPKTNMLLP